MTDAYSAAAIVNSGAEEAAVWLPLLQTLAGGVLAGGVALYVNHLGHKNALKREAERLRNEKQAAEEKIARERYFIGTELVILLEQFAVDCAGVAIDSGRPNEKNEQVAHTTLPSLSYSAVSGDWRVLPAKLMYRIRELPVIQGEADRAIDATDTYPPDNSEFFEIRQYLYTRLGIKAIIQSRRLRQFAGLPNTRLDASPWSAQNVLWQEWKQHRKHLSNKAREMALHQPKFPIANQLRHDDQNDPPISPEEQR